MRVAVVARLGLLEKMFIRISTFVDFAYAFGTRVLLHVVAALHGSG